MTEPCMRVETWREGAVGHVRLDNQPVNAMSAPLRRGLLEAVAWAESETGLERVVVSGKGRVFAAGGDVREFDAPPLEPQLPEVLNRIEACTLPWIAAAHGAALGGGLELMLACRYRTAAPACRLGLPEVTLGLVPGAGGTQRLPRVVGLAAALEMVCMGEPVTSDRARAIGLVDEVADDPVAAAAATPLDTVLARPRVSEMPPPEDDPAALEAVRRSVETRMRGQIAPLRAIELVAVAARTPFPQALKQERETFHALRDTGQSRALRHIFFAERRARAPEWLRGTAPREISEAAVAGGGTMGAAIAYTLLAAGIRVVLVETDAAGVGRATENIERILASSLRRGLIDVDNADEMRAALSVTTDLERCGTAALAIEAVFEDMEVKKAVFRSLQLALPAEAVLASNTSYLDIDEIASVLDEPSRLVGLHFFAPAHIMRLLEIVQGAATSKVALATGFDLARRLGKVPVLAGVCDGFIGNRILARYREAADALLMEGALPWEVDAAMVEFGYAMGPYEAQDLSGLDIAYANRRRQDATRDPDRHYVPIADRMVEAGRLGRKTGLGWYRYDPDGGRSVDPAVETLILREAAAAGVVRRGLVAEEIRRCLLSAMIDEADAILSEGIAQSPSDIDLVTVFGYGFPRWRGGLMHFAEREGLVGQAAVIGRPA